MTDKQQPEALRIADALEMPMADFPTPTVLEARAAAELRRQHAENETLRAKLKTYEDLGGAADDVQLLRMGYAAARLEIESLRAGGAGPSPASQAEAVLINGLTAEETFATASCSGLTEPRPVTAYAALPVTPQFPAHPEPMVMAWSALEISVIAQYGRDMYEAGKRASHGQAPAQAAPAAVAGPSDDALRPAVEHAHEILRRLMYHRDGEFFINVNRRGAEALHVSTIATIAHAALAAVPTTQPAPTPNEDEGISREQWIEQAMRVYLIAGDTEQQAEECAKYLWGELDLDDLADPYDAAMSDVEGRGPAPQPLPAAQGDALDAARWHWLAEYLVGPRTDLDDEIVASETVNDLRKLVDAARAVLARWGQPAHSGEPVATVKGWTNGSYWRNYQVEFHREDLPAGTKLYTAPQPMEREPLTPEQRSAAFARAEKKMQSNINLSWRDAIADEIEAAHGIKGGQP